MKTATVRDLRNHFARISKWIADGQTVQIVKRGKPFARVVPEGKRSGFLGCAAGTGNVPDDLDDPVPARWEASG